MSKKLYALLSPLFVLTLTLISISSMAHATPEYTLTIQDHRFIPKTLEIPVDQKVKLMIVNKDPTPEEFESHELNREKIIGGHKTGIVFVGPLKAGTYPFFGEFNMETAQGQIIVK